MAERITEYTEQRCEFGGPDPGRPVPGIMQVFYEDGVPVMVDFLCPCGCGHTVPTHLVKPGEKKHDRHWHFSAGPTLSPSIRWLCACKAHFNITDGKVLFHEDSGK